MPPHRLPSFQWTPTFLAACPARCQTPWRTALLQHPHKKKKTIWMLCLLKTHEAKQYVKPPHRCDLNSQSRQNQSSGCRPGQWGPGEGSESGPQSAADLGRSLHTGIPLQHTTNTRYTIQYKIRCFNHGVGVRQNNIVKMHLYLCL